MNTLMHHENFWGVRSLGWQADIRFDGWLPLGVREGFHRNDSAFRFVWRVPRLGWAVTVGRMR